MANIYNKANDYTRRKFVQNLAAGLLGVGIAPEFLQNKAYAASKDGGTAKSVIYLYMAGGMSHVDSFDVKPGNSSVMGNTSAIKTNADGVQISSYFPNLAKQMKHVAIVNSLTTTQGAHEPGSYYMHTSYEGRGTIQHPHLGAWTSRLLGSNGTLPPFIKVNSSGTLGAGWMDSTYAALPVENAKDGVRFSKRHKTVTEDMFDKRVAILDKINLDFQQTYKQRLVKSYSNSYSDAVKLMSSADLDVFDISQEKDNIKKSYGENSFGQGCLLARRLVEKGVRFVDVTLGGWDHHDNLQNSYTDRSATLDQALSALISDLQSKGLLNSTMVVLATEFGRTPIINVNNGRDHYPKAFSGLLIGGGIKGGQIYGKTDKNGAEVIENKVKVPDFNATIAYALGLRLDEVLTSSTGRPFTVADKGKPITTIF